MKNELISRAAAIAVADASDYVGLSVEDVKKVTDEVVKGLKRLPSAEPEIIRCRDCKDYQTYWETSYHNRHYCATMDAMMPADDFCSFAERKEDDI